MDVQPVMCWPDEDPLEERRLGDVPVTAALRPCVVVGADEPITVAWGRMRDHGETALVVDESAHVVGLLGLREVSAVWPARPLSRDERTAGDAVRGVRTGRIRATTSVRAAIRQLITERRAAAPVVDADGRAVGLVTALDLLAALGGHPERALR